MGMRVVNLLLAALLLLVQADLWLGRSSLPHVWTLRGELEQQSRDNHSARLRNEQLQAEVADLRAGLEMVEEKARAELGMVKPDEVLVQYTRR